MRAKTLGCLRFPEEKLQRKKEEKKEKKRRGQQGDEMLFGTK